MKFEIYPDKAGETRWRLVANNGKIIADGGEGYNSPGNARRAIKTFIRGVRDASVVTVPKTPPAAETA